MFDELFPETIDQLNKLTIIRYDHIKNTNAPCDEELRRRRHTKREQKFEVFVRVCDNLLADGRMTKATHKRFTHIF